MFKTPIIVNVAHRVGFRSPPGSLPDVKSMKEIIRINWEGNREGHSQFFYNMPPVMAFLPSHVNDKL